MLGTTHARTGIIAGLAAAALAGDALGLTDPVDVVIVCCVAAGAAQLPDIDHPRSNAARLWGWASRLTAVTVAGLSRGVHRSTMRAADRPDVDGHRTLTHTGVVALLWPALWLACALAPRTLPRSELLVLGAHTITLSGALAALAALALAYTLVLGVGAQWAGVLALVWCVRAGAHAQIDTAAELGAHAMSSAPMIACALTLGWLAHLAGDGCTMGGVPLLWPVVIRGQAWRSIGLPYWLRITTGGFIERAVIMPLLLVAGLWLVFVIGLDMFG